MYELWNRFLALPWKDLAAPIVGGTFALTGILINVFHGWFKDQREKKLAKLKFEHEAEVASGQDMTARLNALMDGYEARIHELANDNLSLKSELKEIREHLDRHQRICLGCVHYAERSRASGGSTDY